MTIFRLPHGREHLRRRRSHCKVWRELGCIVCCLVGPRVARVLFSCATRRNFPNQKCINYWIKQQGWIFLCKSQNVKCSNLKKKSQSFFKFVRNCCTRATLSWTQHTLRQEQSMRWKSAAICAPGCSEMVWVTRVCGESNEQWIERHFLVPTSFYEFQHGAQ